MNTDTENSENKLGTAFGDRGTNVNAIAYGHPHAHKIIEEAIEIIRESETGAHLTKINTVHNIPIHVIKGMGASGFNPQANVIYLQVSSKIDKAEPNIILELVKGLREADQHLIGYVAPDPTKDITEYAATMHAKALDSIIYVCRVLKELTNSSYFPVLIDSLKKLGFNSFYNAYLEGRPIDELYDYYAEEFDKTLEGVN